MAAENMHCVGNKEIKQIHITGKRISGKSGIIR
jgi:hypothetical protein